MHHSTWPEEMSMCRRFPVSSTGFESRSSSSSVSLSLSTAACMQRHSSLADWFTARIADIGSRSRGCVLRQRRYYKFDGRSTAALSVTAGPAGPAPSMPQKFGIVYRRWLHLRHICLCSKESCRQNCSDDRTMTHITEHAQLIYNVTAAWQSSWEAISVHRSSTW